jgi:hypothetical protein
VAYGGGLENRFRLFGERGFESHPLRHLGDGSSMMARGYSCLINQATTNQASQLL